VKFATDYAVLITDYCPLITVFKLVFMEKQHGVHIRQVTSEDGEGIWAIYQEVIERGDAFAQYADTPPEGVLARWLSPELAAFVAETAAHTIIGAYLLKPNQPGRGAHIANATYMVASAGRGQGIGRLLAEHSLQTAVSRGYRAMQFNLVVSSNVTAVRLWQSLGFNIIGIVPEAFAHAELGLVDAYIMHRFL
jgi:L-amino acid N-acyltransferase YncA